MLLQGKTICVTGGGTGIGFAVARECLRQGANVLLHHHPLQKEDDIRTEMGESGRDKLLCFAGDIREKKTSEQMIDLAVQHWKTIHGVVVNAGICQFHDFLTTPENVVKDTIDINLIGAYYTTQCAGAQFARQDHGGSIVGMASISMLIGGGSQVHYTCTKAGVHSLMQSSAIALGKYNVRCNSILPGTIETRLNTHVLQGEDRKHEEARTTVGRIGCPEDIAGPAVFLLSDMSTFMSGAQILVDGGVFTKCNIIS